MSTSVGQCQTMSDNVRQCPPMSTIVVTWQLRRYITHSFSRYFIRKNNVTPILCCEILIFHWTLSLATLWVIFAHLLTFHFWIWSIHNHLWSVLIETFSLRSSWSMLYWIHSWAIVVLHNSWSCVLMITWGRSGWWRFSWVWCFLNWWRKSWIVLLWYFEFHHYFVLALILFLQSKYFPFLQVCQLFTLSAHNLVLFWCMKFRDGVRGF